MKRKVAIIGGGLVGSLWAVLLQKRGYEVSVYEKRADIRKEAATEERSINLVITSRGLKGLERAGLLDEAIALSVPILGRMIHSKSGELAYQPYGNTNECNFSISRSELNKFLLSAAEGAGAQLFFSHALEDIDFQGKTLVFHNYGAVATKSYDLLFGTDGAGSQVRKTLCKKFPQDFQETTEWLEADYKELFMPAGSGIEKNALHIWPRGSHMLMGLANLDGSFTMTLYMPRAGTPISFGSFKTREETEKLFKSEFGDAVALMPHYQQNFLKNPQGRLGTVRCSEWVYQDSVVLMGDAAHAIVPFFGQGMNAGFEDCTTFLRILDENHDNWATSIPEYERIQKPNANAIADMAVENWYEMRDKVGDARFLLRKKVEALLEKNFPQFFKSRYGMVTYTLTPYSQAQQAGFIQDRLLSKLCADISTPEEVSLKEAESLMKEELIPFNEKNQLRLETDALVIKTKQRLSASR